MAASTRSPSSIAAGINRDPDATFETDGDVEAAQTLHEWASNGHFGTGYDGLNNEDAIGGFADGNGVFLRRRFLERNLPRLRAVRLRRSCLGRRGRYRVAWHISSTTAHQDAAIAFLAMLRPPDPAQGILDTGWLPALTDGVTDVRPLGPVPRIA